MLDYGHCISIKLELHSWSFHADVWCGDLVYLCTPFKYGSSIKCMLISDDYAQSTFVIHVFMLAAVVCKCCGESLQLWSILKVRQSLNLLFLHFLLIWLQFEPSRMNVQIVARILVKVFWLSLQKTKNQMKYLVFELQFNLPSMIDLWFMG